MKNRTRAKSSTAVKSGGELRDRVADSAAEISLCALTKRFASPMGRAKLVLDAIDLTFERGQVTCLVGPSGCGKTTILNIIAGFEPASDGRVELDGVPTSRIGPDRAVVFQQPALFPWLNVMGNVVAGAKARGESLAQCRQAAGELIERLGLKGSEELFPYQLSGGMKQRVQIARALLTRPGVLLMDEPFGALDAQTRLSLQELMLQLWRSVGDSSGSPTVVFVTHDVEEATLLGDKVIVLARNPGRIRECVHVRVPEPRTYETLSNPDFVATKQRLLDLLHSID